MVTGSGGSVCVEGKFAVVTGPVVFGSRGEEAVAALAVLRNGEEELVAKESSHINIGQVGVGRFGGTRADGRAEVDGATA